jgi:hypothetical protein
MIDVRADKNGVEFWDGTVMVYDIGAEMLSPDGDVEDWVLHLRETKRWSTEEVIGHFRQESIRRTKE